MSTSPSSSTRLTLLPTSYLSSLPPDSEVTLGSLVETQDRLADEAREAMPYAFDECSYGKGYLRQSVWSCIDCGEIGVCYGCSISCHSEHKLVELWTRRRFRCDCPTDLNRFPDRPARKRKCSLDTDTSVSKPLNAENTYNKNYTGEFCRCGREYDPETETEGMLCCIGCEDWFHESCLNLRPPKGDPALLAKPTGEADDEEEDDDEAGILIPSESYDGLVCADCAKGNAVLDRLAGSEGYMVIEPDGQGGWKVVGRATAGVDGQARVELDGVEAEEEASSATADTRITADIKPTVATTEGGAQSEIDEHPTDHPKRPLESADSDPDESDTKTKRLKTEQTMMTEGSRKGKGDVFLAHGIRQRLLSELSGEEQSSLPFPLVDEEIYEPPQDRESSETLEEVTERVVGNMPRVQAIEALHGYQRLKDRLHTMLQAHAQAGRVVSKDNIDEMFENLRNGGQSA